jgi:hypothetical protein
MLRKLLEIFKFNLEVEPIVYTTQNTPFLFNYEYYNFSWGTLQHNGFFIDPYGNVLHYVNDDRVKSICGSVGAEIYARFKPSKLFKNLNRIENRSRHYNTIDININEIWKNLSKSEYYEHPTSAIDAGVESFSIFIYDDSTKLYARIVLKTFGEKFITNKSIYTSQLLKYFINYNVIKHYKKLGF